MKLIRLFEWFDIIGFAPNLLEFRAGCHHFHIALTQILMDNDYPSSLITQIDQLAYDDDEPWHWYRRCLDLLETLEPETYERLLNEIVSTDRLNSPFGLN